MKFRLEATPDELATKSPDLIRALGDQLRGFSPEISAILEKALPRKEQILKFPALLGLQRETEALYQSVLDSMVKEIGQVLDKSVRKSGTDHGAVLELLDRAVGDTELAAEMEKAVTAEGGITPGGNRKVRGKNGKWEYIPVNRAAEDHLVKLTAAVQKLGGKVAPVHGSLNEVMVKIPKAHAKVLVKLKQELGLPGEIIIGGKYAMIPIDKTSAGSMLKVAGKKEPKESAPEIKPAKPEMKGAKAQKADYAPMAAGWKPHATVEEANAWAKALGVHTDYPSLKVANASNQALSEQHPLILKHIQFVGTGAQLKKWAKDNPEMNDIAKQGKHHTDLAKHNPLGSSAIAVAHPMDQKPYTMSVVIINEGYYNDGYADKIGGKGSFSSTGNLINTIRHEFGHVEGFVLRHLKVAGDKSAWDVWRDHCYAKLNTKEGKAEVVQTVSQYGSTNPHEAWAEIAVLRREGKPLAPWILEALKAMKIDSQNWDTLKNPESKL